MSSRTVKVSGTPYKALCQAIEQNSAAKLRQLVKADSTAAGHWKPVMDAAFLGRPELVRILLDAGANPNIVAGTPGRHTPLIRIMQHHATIPRHDGHEAAARMLLEAGADPNLAAGPHNFEPLVYAAMGGATSFINLLLEYGAGMNIHLAAVLYDRSQLKSFLKRAGTATVYDAQKRTPLHHVALSGLWRVESIGSQPALDCARLLLEAGVQVDAPEDLGESERDFRATALWRAVGWQEHAALAKYLLDAGADPNPAVFAGTYTGDVTILELLHQHGANWNLEHEGRTPIADLMYYKRPAAVLWLLAHGADPNARDKTKRTALHYAAIQGVKDSYVAALLNAGAKPGFKDADGKTALDYAREKGRTGIVSLLRTQ